jgi:DNA-binding CsgD family transcriptional regulator
MAVLSVTPSVRRQLRAIEAELDTVRLDGESPSPSGVRAVLPQIRELLEAEVMVLYCPVEDAQGFMLERFEHSSDDRAAELERRTRDFFARAPRRYAWYDPSRPEPAQRNRVIDPVASNPYDDLMRLPIYTEVIEPVKLQRYHQPRILICDGDSLLGWFGAFHDRPFDRRQNALLAWLGSALRRRLRFERDLALSTRVRSVLEHALEHVGAPALVIGARGQVYETNAAGRALLDGRSDEVDASLAAALAGRTGPLAIELTRIAVTGTPVGYLAIVRSGTSDARIAGAVAAAAQRWALTPRQREVLELVARGAGTATIAGNLRISTRAVELHLTRLFDRAGVDHRAALVAAVLAAAP